jgi:SulP family sulfate permease
VHPTLPTDERIIVMRFDGQLYFANVSYFEDTILSAVADHPNAKFVLVVADGINQVDASGEEVLHHLIERLGGNGITIVLSGMKRQVVQLLDRTHVMERLGRENIFATEEMALDAIYERLSETGYRPLRMPPQGAPEPA